METNPNGVVTQRPNCRSQSLPTRTILNSARVPSSGFSFPKFLQGRVPAHRFRQEVHAPSERSRKASGPIERLDRKGL